MLRCTESIFEKSAKLPLTYSIFRLNVRPASHPPGHLLPGCAPRRPWSTLSLFLHPAPPWRCWTPPLAHLSCVFNQVVSPTAWKKSSGLLYSRSEIKEKTSHQENCFSPSPSRTSYFSHFTASQGFSNAHLGTSSIGATSEKGAS